MTDLVAQVLVAADERLPSPIVAVVFVLLDFDWFGPRWYRDYKRNERRLRREERAQRRGERAR